MEKIGKTGIVFMFAVFCVFSAIPVSAQENNPAETQSLKVEIAEGGQVLQQVSTLEDEMIGYIDWENNVVYAVGDGVPPEKAVSPAQARVRAKRAAIDTAMARLLETIKEVRVDSESTTRNYINEHHVVHTQVSGFVKNAVIEELRQAEDGSYQIKMSMPINGDRGLSAALLPFEMRKVGIVTRVVREQKAPVKKQNSVNIPETKQTAAVSPETAAVASEAAEAEAPPVYTGLIINAKGLNASPGMYPNIRTGSGKVIYNISVADPNASVSEGLCAYRKALEQARKIDSLGDSPLLVKAVEVDGKNRIDLIIEDSDGEKIIRADIQSSFLKEARVAVVID
ncbi:MAG: hypothetical protein V2I97_24845 [Desulfococcaceae bacterium]|nr:hypothetical protein [Desulfococcaceae bacterium]